MGNTILYGIASNEGPAGDIQTSPTFTSRPETQEEQRDTAAYAEAAFRKLGIRPQPARVEFFGDIARVIVRGKSVLVRPTDL